MKSESISCLPLASDIHDFLLLRFDEEKNKKNRLLTERKNREITFPNVLLVAIQGRKFLSTFIKII